MGPWKGPVWNDSPRARVRGTCEEGLSPLRSCSLELGIGGGLCSRTSLPLPSGLCLCWHSLSLTSCRHLSACSFLSTPRLSKSGAWQRQRPEKLMPPRSSSVVLCLGTGQCAQACVGSGFPPDNFRTTTHLGGEGRMEGMPAPARPYPSEC